MGLTLPSEARWEYACRGGRAGRFSCAEEDLSSYANVADKAYANQYIERRAPEPWNDGFPAHAPVGSFLPNGFGFHDMHGTEDGAIGLPTIHDVVPGPGQSLLDLLGIARRKTNGAGDGCSAR